MSEFYSRERCPECQTGNWVYQGRSDDDGTDPYVEAIECFNCSHKFLLDGDLEEFLCTHNPFETEADENEWYEHHRIPAHMKTKKGLQKLIENYAFIEKGRETP